MINFLFSGWLSSLIISMLVSLIFYFIGIKPYLRKIVNTDLASKIAQSIAGVSGGNMAYVQQQTSNNQIEANLLEELFPEAFNYVKSYETSTFIEIKNKYNLTCNFSTFCQKDSNGWEKLPKYEKKKIEKERKTFLIKVAKLVII